MIDGLGAILPDSGHAGLAELRSLLAELLDRKDRRGRFLDAEALRPSRKNCVFRLRFDFGGEIRSVVVKSLGAASAIRNENVARRWLPAIGLSESGPPLLGSAAARSGACVWHVYADLGSWELDPEEPDPARVEAAVATIARIHTRFSGHPLMGEVRLHGGDMGIRFYEATVRDAAAAIQAWRPPAEHRALRDRLLARLHGLRKETTRRAARLAALGGPETLLHGDLWSINVFVVPTERGPRARLIDWDHAAIGPATYDLSTFLLRFPERHRPWILDLYERAVAPVGRRLPSRRDLNLLFETHEYARFANRLIWPGIALVMQRAEWGPEALAEVERWFEGFTPVLPDAPEAPAAASAGGLSTRRARARPTTPI